MIGALYPAEGVVAFVKGDAQKRLQQDCPRRSLVVLDIKRLAFPQGRQGNRLLSCLHGYPEALASSRWPCILKYKT